MARGKKRQGETKQVSGGKPAKIEDDAALWAAFTQHIDPLELKGRVPDVEADFLNQMLHSEAVKPGAARAPGSARQRPEAKPISVANGRSKAVPQPGNVDGRAVHRLGSGRSGVDARIDLHGMRQREAHSALRVFLFRSVAKGHRMVLVITGKGSGQRQLDGETGFDSFINEGAVGRGVLRRNVPLWLAEPDLRAIVVGFTVAHIRHGGEGALYVQLRRQR